MLPGFFRSGQVCTGTLGTERTIGVPDKNVQRSKKDHAEQNSLSTHN
jgi:hypothetical protein